MSLLKKIVLVAAPIAIGMAVPSLASAQNTQAQNIPFNGTACPPGYERGSARTPSRNNTNVCYDRRSDAARSNTNVAKPHRLDRCPLAYFTSDSDPMMCATRLVNPPTIRVKGSGPCRAGEVEDWGVWCVSNYAALTRGEAATALRDWNAIYTLNRATPPRQEDLPEGSEYTPAYITIFGRVRADGSPMSGGASVTATPAAPAAPTGPSGTGSMNPQPRNQVASLCPEGWFGGLAGTARPDPNMCYPGPGALPAYPPQREGEPCAPGHVVSSTWCVNVSGATGAQAAAQPAQTAPNCPPASTGTAAQAGAALGGLLGARRGNGQAGAAIGGLLGQAAGGATQRPPGC